MRKAFWMVLGFLAVGVAPVGAFPSAAYLKLEPSVRLAGMGEVGIALGNTVLDALTNPAALARVHRFQFEANYMEWLDGIQYSVAGVAFRPYKKVAEGEKPKLSALSYGLSVMQLAAGDFERRNVDGEFLGMYDARATVLGFSFGRILYKGIYGGLTGKWIMDNIDGDRATGYAFDLGMLYAVDPTYAFSFVIRNLGPGLSSGRTGAYTQTRFALPSEARLGVSYIYRNPSFGYFAMNLDLGWMGLTSTDPSDQYASIGVGSELNIMDYLVLRGGYRKPLSMHALDDQGNVVQATYIPSVYGFGATVFYGPLRVDYAYYVRNEFMKSHRFGLGMVF